MRSGMQDECIPRIGLSRLEPHAPPVVAGVDVDAANPSPSCVSCGNCSPSFSTSTPALALVAAAASGLNLDISTIDFRTATCQSGRALRDAQATVLWPNASMCVSSACLNSL
jgi:hypothetical protein